MKYADAARVASVMKKVACVLRSHERLTLNWVRARGEISTGAVEGLNNKIRVVTRRSYGFHTFYAMEMALYHTLGRPRIAPQILLSRGETRTEKKRKPRMRAGYLKKPANCGITALLTNSYTSVNH